MAFSRLFVGFFGYWDRGEPPEMLEQGLVKSARRVEAVCGGTSVA
jgi:hypothetical protein